MTTELMTIDAVVALKGKKAIEVLSSPEKLQPLVDHVRTEALSVQYDVTTSKGRKDVGTAANNVVQSRKPIVEAIEKHISEHQAVVTGLKEAKSFIENEFKLIKGEVLKPRTEWQAEQDRLEQERVDAIHSRIDNIRAVAHLSGTEDRAHIEELIEALEAQDLSTDFDEFTQLAMQARQEAIAHLNARIMQIIEEANALKMRIEMAINDMKSKVADAMDLSKSEIQKVIEEVEGIVIDSSYGEREQEAQLEKDKALKNLSKLHLLADDDEPESLPFTDHMISEEDEAIFNDCVADAPSIPQTSSDEPLVHSMCEYMEGLMTEEQALHLINMVRNYGV